VRLRCLGILRSPTQKLSSHSGKSRWAASTKFFRSGKSRWAASTKFFRSGKSRWAASTKFFPLGQKSLGRFNEVFPLGQKPLGRFNEVFRSNKGRPSTPTPQKASRETENRPATQAIRNPKDV
jgi:hypothetical protein